MILNDRWLITQSTPPTHVLFDEHRKPVPALAGVTHTQEQLDDLVKRYHATKVDDAILKELNWQPMIEPFIRDKVKWAQDGSRIASKGVTSFGYDISAAAEFKVFKGCTEDGRIDYKNISDDMFETVHADSVWIPPNSFILARSVEYVRIPRNTLALCIGKSTIARVGINCLCTPLEPEWEGHITLEFSNSTNLPNRFYAHEGCLQLVFLQGEDCMVSYAESGGKYQAQGAQIILPRV